MTKRTLALALLFGTSVAFGSYLLKWQFTNSPESRVSEVVVLMDDIPKGAVLSAEMLASRQYSSIALPFGIVSKLDDAIGRVSQVSVRKGVLLESHLAPKGTMGGLTGLIPAGMRAFTIHTPSVASGLAGLVQPSDHVDVLLTIDREDRDSPGGGATAVSLLRDMVVLAVDQKVEVLPVAEPENFRGRGSAMQPAAIKSVTLLATPDQAMRLGLAQTMGTLQLSLRNPESVPEDSGQMASITFNQLLGREEARGRAVQVVTPTPPAQPVEEVAPVRTPVEEQPPALPPIMLYAGTSRSVIPLHSVFGRQSSEPVQPVRPQVAVATR